VGFPDGRSAGSHGVWPTPSVESSSSLLVGAPPSLLTCSVFSKPFSTAASGGCSDSGDFFSGGTAVNLLC
jgi:hypothetical protein